MKGLIIKEATSVIRIKSLQNGDLCLFIEGKLVVFVLMVQIPEALEIKQDPLPLVLQCSVTCGVGIMHRSVQCLTNDDQLSNLCHVDLKPEERRTCHNVHDCESAALHHPLLFLCLEHLFLSSSWRCAVFPSVGSHPAKH